MAGSKQVRRNRPYWDGGGRRLLRELTFLFMHRQGSGGRPLSVTALSRLLLGETSKAKDRAHVERLRRYLYNLSDQPHSDTLLDEIFGLVIPWFEQNRSRPNSELAKTGYLSQIQSRSWFSYIKQSRRLSADTKEADDAAQNAAEMADMLALGFGVTLRDYEEAAEQIVGKRRCSGEEAEDRDRAGFLMYRYATTAGNIVRTFTVVTPPSSKHPFCWFRNYYCYPGLKRVRECSGIVVRFSGTIYMIAILPPHDGVKLIALPASSGKADILPGLIATSNHDGAPLMSRVVLERTSAVDLKKVPENSEPSVLSYPVLSSELSNDEIVSRIRNYIGFQIGDELLWNSDDGSQGVSANRMVELVSEKCKGMFTLRGAEFNPADHIHYPFNQALTMFAPTEVQAKPRTPGST